MENEHIRRLQIMSEEDFRALLDDLSDHSRPIKEKLDFAQELSKSGIKKTLCDEASFPRKLIPKKPGSSTSNTSTNNKKGHNGNSKLVNNTSKSGTKSMHDLRENHDHDLKGSSVKSIPLKDTQYRMMASECQDNNNVNGEHCSRRTHMTGNNLHTISGVRDSYVNNQIDDSDPSAGINFFPTSSLKSSICSSKHPSCCERSESTSQQLDPYLSNSTILSNNDNNNTALKSRNSIFSGRDSLRDLERCVEQINPASVPIYDSVCRLNRNSINHSSSNSSAYRRINRDLDEDDSDKMEFGESQNFEHRSRIIEFRKNYSPVNKDGKIDSLLATPREPENSNSLYKETDPGKKVPRKQGKKTQEPFKKAEEIPGHVGHIDINLLDSFIKGETNHQELLDGFNGASPENGQEPKKNKKKLKKKLNRDNRSVSEKNLPINKQNNTGRTVNSSSKPVSSNEASSSEVDELSPPSSSQTLQTASQKSQSLFLAEYEFMNRAKSQDDLDEYQTVSDPEVDREMEFVTPKNKTFKKNKKISSKAPKENAAFDSRRGFSKRELKRPSNSTLHNGYESEKDVHNFVPESLPLKISARNVIAPTSRVLPIVLDEPDLPHATRAPSKSASFDSESQIQQGNIVNGYFPRINNDFVILEPQTPLTTSGALSYAQIAKNIDSASNLTPPTSSSSISSNSVPTNIPQKSHKPEKKARNNSLPTNPPANVPIPESEPEQVCAEPKNIASVIQNEPDLSQLNDTIASEVQTLCVVCTGDNLFTVESVSLEASKENDNKRFMFGNFDNEEIDSVLQGATFSPLEECFVPKKRAKSVEAPRSPTVVSLPPPQRPPSSNDGHNSSSSVINYHHLSTCSPLSSPSNLDSSIASSSFKSSNTTGTDTASSGFDQHMDTIIPVVEILPALKPVPLPTLSSVSVNSTVSQPPQAPAHTQRLTHPEPSDDAPFVSCISQLKNLKFNDPIDKNSFNYYAAVNFVRDSWNEFSRLKTV